MDLKQLAERLKLSPTTVSRVLNGKADAYRIGKETQARVRAAAEKFAISVNQQARSLRLQSTQAVGLIVPDISNPWFAALAQQVEHSVRARGYSVLLADSREDERVEIESLGLMRRHRVDGLIVAPVGGEGGHLVELAKQTHRVVLVDRVARKIEADSVVLDNAGAAKAGVGLLGNAGHRGIACLRGRAASYVDRERVKGFTAALAERKLPVRAEWIAGEDYTVASGRDAMRTLLGGRERPTAVLALSNVLALGALEALREAGLRAPEDVSIVSFDEQPWAAFLSPPLTTIAQPVREMGELAVRCLFERLGQKRRRNPPQRTVLPFSIQERGSVAAR